MEGFAKKVVSSQDERVRGVMDNESGEFTEGDEERGIGRSESDVERLVRGCWTETGSLFQKRGEAYRKERSVILRRVTSLIDCNEISLSQTNAQCHVIQPITQQS